MLAKLDRAFMLFAWALIVALAIKESVMLVQVAMMYR